MGVQRKPRPIAFPQKIVFFLLLGGCLLSGCGSPYKAFSLNPVKLFQDKGQNVLNSNKPSSETRQSLRLLFLEESYRKDPSQVIRTFQQKIRREPTPESRIALAEIALLEARKIKRSDPHMSMVYYVIAVQQCYDYLFSDDPSNAFSPLDPSYRFVADMYNFAMAQIIVFHDNQTNIWFNRDFTYEGVNYHYEVINEGAGIWNPRLFDYIYNTYEVRVSGLTNEYVTKGLGAPLVGIVDRPVEKEAFGRFYPLRLAAYPMSAVILFDPPQQTDAGPTRSVRLVLYDPLQIDSIPIQGKTVPLAADFTTPLGLQIQNVNPFEVGLHNLFHSDDEVKNAGVYMLEPYRPDKVPVLLVHGLMSSPATWISLFNDLRGDPELRKRYQFWFFMYPTGLPIAYSASILRDQLNEIRGKFDPQGTNPNFNQMVLVGHSMGGLLSRMMVQNPGMTYWNYAINKPYESLDLDEQNKQLLKKLLIFDSLPFVKRVVFVCTPHRGSPMADQWYTKLAAGIVNLPGNFVEGAGKAVQGHFLTPEVAAVYTKRVPNSLSILSPSSLFMKLTPTVPLISGVHYHSIIGIQKGIPGPGSSDGIVPFESSHLEGAESEAFVPCDHSAQEHPLAIIELKRILHEHLKAIAGRK